MIRWHCDNLILELVNVTATVGDESEGASVGTLWIQMVEPHEPVKHQPSGGYMLDNRQVQMTCAKSAGVRLGDRIKFVALAHSSLLSTGDRLANTGLSKQRNREDFDTPQRILCAETSFPEPLSRSLFVDSLVAASYPASKLHGRLRILNTKAKTRKSEHPP